jgi:hypothetical protein
VSPITEDDLDRLADYAAGVLDPPEAAEVNRLIATEPAWARAHDALVAAQPRLAETLSALSPEPMPAEVAARLDRAIAAASRETDSAKVIQLDRRRRWSRVAAGAAAAVVVVGAGIAGLTALNHSASREATSSAGSAVTPAGAKNALSLPHQGTLITTASGIDYTHDTLALAGSPPDAAVSGAEGAAGAPHADQAQPTAGYPTELARLAGPTALDDCLTAIGTAEGGRPTSVDFARYQGQPALIVALNGGSARVVVAGPDCGLAGRGAALLDSLS